jgi:hypothetical protein
VGKTAILGLGYGCGWEKFRHMLFIGNGGMSVSVDEDEAKRIVYTNYRSTYPEIPMLWERCEWVLLQAGRSAEPARCGRRHSRRCTDRYRSRHRSHAGVIRPGFDALWLP